MLILSQIPLAQCTTASATEPGKCLGAVVFGAPVSAIDNACIAPGTALIAPKGAFMESWRTTAHVIEGQLGALHYRYDGQILFGSIMLAESDFADDTTGTALQNATTAAYRLIFELLDRLRYPNLWRVWNFIPRINAETDGIERYRQFNIARSTAFLHSGRAIEGNVPAASAVGCDGTLLVYFLAGQQNPLAIENPRQISAYQYPGEYGPRSPIFSRANVIELDAQEMLFISGTASIVGHRTLHADDIAAQTRELLANIDAVIEAANASTRRKKFARGELVYRVYLRHTQDYLCVHNALHDWLGAEARAVYLQADICRADLLVEIEASGGHLLELPC